MLRLDNQLKSLIFKHVDFQLDGKSIKKGKIQIFNTKQFFIKFKLDNGGDIKEYELPYPFKVVKIPNGYLFDYSLSAFIPRTEEMYWKMKCMNKSEASKLHDSYLYVLTLSS